MYNLKIENLNSINLQQSNSSDNLISGLTNEEIYNVFGGATISGSTVTINAKSIIGEGAEIIGTEQVNLNAPFIYLPNSSIVS